ncbi:MAG TPA: alcohol dehydrogenase catalytic domain-containing protein [Candidatus Hydrogenedentes bacterium]|nr:alcohol dehydrogenase catalytic domain-containing protein [Candidatus Hydrogenedentota bacterium]
MKALVFDSSLQVVEMPIPVPESGEALIRVLAAGICRTDSEIKRGYMKYRGVLGHEFVGVVEKASNTYLVGKRVVGEINCVCGRCVYCKMEMSRHCVNRTVLGIQERPGAFAEYTTLPETNLHLVPDGVHEDVAVFTEPLAAAFRIVEQLSILADDRIVVLGDGKLGQLVAQTLWLYSKNIVCVGRHRWKLDLLSRLGIATALNTDTLEGRADVVVEATGTPAGLQRALALVRPEGTVVLKTTCAEGFQMDAVGAVVNEVRILGSRCGPFRPALEALAMGTIETRPMVSERYPLGDALRAMSRAEEPDVMKVILHMW